MLTLKKQALVKISSVSHSEKLLLARCSIFTYNFFNPTGTKRPGRPDAVPRGPTPEAGRKPDPQSAGPQQESPSAQVEGQVSPAEAEETQTPAYLRFR